MSSSSHTGRECFRGRYDSAFSRKIPRLPFVWYKRSSLLSFLVCTSCMTSVCQRLLRVLMTEIQNLVTCRFATTSETCLKLDWVIFARENSTVLWADSVKLSVFRLQLIYYTVFSPYHANDGHHDSLMGPRCCAGTPTPLTSAGQRKKKCPLHRSAIG